MKSMTQTILAALTLLAFSWTSAQAATVVFGNSPNDWATLGFSDDLQTDPDALGTGIDASIVQDGITFTLNVLSTAGGGGQVQLMTGDGHLGPATGGNAWEDINTDGTLIFKLSITDPGSQLQSIKVGSFDIGAWNGNDEDMRFTSFGTSTVDIDPTVGSTVDAGVVDYDDLGITQLTLGNISTWTFEMEVIGTGAVQGVDRINFDYTLVPEPSSFALLLGGLGALAFLRRRL